MVDQYGTVIFNYSGKCIIDNTYKNYAIHSTGSMNLVAGLNAIYINSGEPVMVGIRPSTVGYCRWVSMDMYGSVITYAYILSTTTQTIDYIILKSANVIAVEDYGVAFYDAGGNIVFSSSDNYAKYVAEGGGGMDGDYTAAEVSEYAYNADTNYFVMNLSSPNLGYWHYQGYMDNYTYAIRKIDTHTLGVKPVLWYQYNMGRQTGFSCVITANTACQWLELKV